MWEELPPERKQFWQAAANQKSADASIEDVEDLRDAGIYKTFIQEAGTKDTPCAPEFVAAAVLKLMDLPPDADLPGWSRFSGPLRDQVCEDIVQIDDG